MQKYLQNFQKLNLYSRKIQNVQFLVKNCAICFLLFMPLERDIKRRNPMTGSRSKYIFSWVRVKYVIQAVCLRTKAVGIKALL